jgi:ribosome-associated protein
MMIKISPDITIADSELAEQFVRASGPGGQNVNKVSTAVQLRFNVYASPSLPWDVRARLIKIAGTRINAEGELIVTAQRFRTQSQNREDARERLAEIVRSALHAPKPRRKTKPSAGAKRRRVESKQRQGELKRTRAKNPRGVE